MATFIYENFDEIEESLRRNAPKTIFKYKGGWTDKHQRALIVDQIAWFGAPRTMNDPYDIRTPLRFDIREIENPKFLEKMKAHLSQKHPGYDDHTLRIISENQLDIIRQNPKNHFESNYRKIRESDIYDVIGLFCCSFDELNETMWAHYGNNHTGFVVGFDTVLLAKDLLCSCAFVEYSDEIPLQSFLTFDPINDNDQHFLKSKKWEYEKEFRFITYADDGSFNRAKKFSVNAVSEFLLGEHFPEDQKDGFISTVRNIYSQNIPVFQIVPQVSDYGYTKKQIA